MAPLASFGFGVQAGLLLLLHVDNTRALFNGNPVRSSSDVPGVTGSLFRMVTDEEEENAANCTSGDEGIVPFCTVALISPGVVLTAAHCLQNEITAGNPRAFADLRVALGRKITYQNDDGSCARRVLGTADGIYRVRAAFWPNGFQAFSTNRNEVPIAMDYMDYLVLYLDTCVTSTGGATSKIAGAAFADYVRARGGGPGLNTSFWGYGENEMGAANFDGVARTATYTWTRTTSTSGATSQRNMWIDCHWLPDSAPTWQYSQGIAAYTDTSSMAATPNLMCAASNPMNIQLCDQITDQTRCLNAMRTTRPPILSFCEWVNDGCHVNPLVGGGNGVVTLPAPGGGDSGGPFWVRNGNTYVHAGLLMGGSEMYPRWAIASRTDYIQNWLLAALDRDTCITGSSLDHFEGYNAGATGLHPSAPTDFRGGLASSTSLGDLSQLPVRGRAPPPPPPPSPTATQGPCRPWCNTQRFPNRCNWRRNCGGCPSCGQSTETGYVSEDQDNVKAKKSGAQNVLQA